MQCGDAKVAAWKLIPTVWEIWCMNGKVEQREPGAWPEPVREDEGLAMVARSVMQVSAPLVTFEASSDFGWVVAVAGNKFCPRSPKTGWCDDPQPATVGATYLTYAGRLTHVTLLDCGNEHVLEAIAQKWANVFCVQPSGGVTRFNADDAKLTPMLVFSNHDRLMMGRGTEGVR